MFSSWLFYTRSGLLHINDNVSQTPDKPPCSYDKYNGYAINTAYILNKNINIRINHFSILFTPPIPMFLSPYTKVKWSFLPYLLNIYIPNIYYLFYSFSCFQNNILHFFLFLIKPSTKKIQSLDLYLIVKVYHCLLYLKIFFEKFCWDKKYKYNGTLGDGNYLGAA